MTRLIRFITASLLLLVSAQSIHAEFDPDRRKTIGLDAGYASRNTSAYAGVHMRYRFSRIFSINPQINFVVRHKQSDAFLALIDGHFYIPVTSGKWDLYGIAGTGFSSWSERELAADGVSFDRRRHGNLCLDAGAGVAVNLTQSLRLALEVKGNFVSHYTTALAGLSIGYNF